MCVVHSPGMYIFYMLVLTICINVFYLGYIFTEVIDVALDLKVLHTLLLIKEGDTVEYVLAF